MCHEISLWITFPVKCVLKGWLATLTVYISAVFWWQKENCIVSSRKKNTVACEHMLGTNDWFKLNLSNRNPTFQHSGLWPCKLSCPRSFVMVRVCGHCGCLAEVSQIHMICLRQPPLPPLPEAFSASLISAQPSCCRERDFCMIVKECVGGFVFWFDTMLLSSGDYQLGTALVLCPWKKNCKTRKTTATSNVIYIFVMPTSTSWKM